ncbi:MAG: ABC transporter ATP-binding protein [Lachnospiraceae bacterium]|nr:ABC transporter ATP-binding protein [Lachnospiraceae bacterium]
MAEVAIETKKMTKRFGLVTAVDKADMHVTRGAIYGLIGKKGAGKSTMLRMLAGLQKPTAGSYEVFGTEMNGKCAGGARRRVGIVTEGWFTVPGWKLEDAVKRQCRLLGIPGKEKAEEVLGITGLKKYAGTRIEKLPEEKRISARIAFALCGSPDLLLLDDVFAGGNLQQKAETEELLKRLNRDFNITIVVTAEEPEALEEIADSFGIMDHGELRKELSADEMRALHETALRVRVTDVNALARVLVEQSLRHRILDGETAEIYGKPHITGLVTALAKEACEVISMEERTVQTESLLAALGGEV